MSGRYKKIILAFFLSFFLIAIFLFILYGSYFKKVEVREIAIGQQKFSVEIAKNEAERNKGLSGRKSICPSCGMLFEFPVSGNHSFWMKNMEFSLDIIWILNGEIVYISNNVSPSSYPETLGSQIVSDKVLEVNGGICEKNGMKIGDKVIF